MFNLGCCYSNGNGVAQDKTEAFEWFSQAAELGNANAMFNVGDCYDQGDGVAQDKKKAFECFTEVADMGYSYAMAWIGNRYETGDDIYEQDMVEAVKWYTKAAECGSSLGMTSLL